MELRTLNSGILGFNSCKTMFLILDIEGKVKNCSDRIPSITRLVIKNTEKKNVDNLGQTESLGKHFFYWLLSLY
jgi:hypothetical protein